MKINFRNDRRDILEIEDARIVYRNFRGEIGKYNRDGERSFAVVIPNEEIFNELHDAGYNVKIKPSRDADDQPFMFLSVKVKYNENGRGPAIYVESGEHVTKLNKDTVLMLDEIDIAYADMDIRPFDWEINGKSGRSAYLDAMNVVQNIDRFGARYMEENRIINTENNNENNDIE